jgi:hypothetical protein
MLSISVVSMDVLLLDLVHTAYKEDKFFSLVIAHSERYSAYTLYDDLLFYCDRLYIPANDRITRETLLTTYHDDCNYFDDCKTRVAITTNYF